MIPLKNYQELLEVLNYWAIDESGQLCQDKFNSLLHGYHLNMAIEKVNWESVLNSGYCGMLGWLEYNLKRALGMEGKGEVERTLGEEQIRSTIDSLYQYDQQIPVLFKWLEQAK